MKAKDVMSKGPKTVQADTSVRDAAKLMKSEDVGLIPVVAGGGESSVVGVITDRDIAIRCVAEGKDSGTCTVRELMSAGATTCRPDDDLDDVMAVMGKEQIRRIPVVDERGMLVGIVAQADIARNAKDKKSGDMVEKISQPN
jgi:CBS domain-containing protein